MNGIHEVVGSIPISSTNSTPRDIRGRPGKLGNKSPPGQFLFRPQDLFPLRPDPGGRPPKTSDDPSPWAYCSDWLGRANGPRMKDCQLTRSYSHGTRWRIPNKQPCAGHRSPPPNVIHTGGRGRKTEPSQGQDACRPLVGPLASSECLFKLC